MKTFVWNNVLTDWTSGMVVVMADSLEEAQEMACNRVYGGLKDSKEYKNDILWNQPVIYENEKGVEYVWGGG